MRIDWRRIIRRIHASGRRIVLSITGGGSGAIAQLLQVPGGSKSLIEAVVPYDFAALVQFLGSVPDQACSGETAMAMARRAHQRAAWLASSESPAIGIGMTASLVSDRPKRGAHRFHIAAAGDAEQHAWSIVLAKGRRTRREEEDVAARATLLALAAACGIAAPPVRSLLGKNERLSSQIIVADDPLAHLVRGSVQRVTVMPDRQILRDAAVPNAVLPGSFHPLHAGHRELAQVAAELLRCAVSYELSVVNVDKPALSASAVRQRLNHIPWCAPIELTRAATFLEKSRLFPNAVFVVGVDTARRILDAAYYGGSVEQMTHALDEIVSRGGRFLVAGRADRDGRFCTLADLAIPARFAALFDAIAESQFRRDISSTELRCGTVS